MITRGPCFTARVYKQGNSTVIVLGRDLLAQLCLKVGDLLVIRVHSPYATFRKIDLTRAVPLDELSVSDLPPNSLTGVRRD